MQIIKTEKELKDSVKKLQKEEIIACDTETSGLDIKVAKIEGIGYGTNKHTFFISFPHTIPHEILVEQFNLLFEKTVIFHNAKYDIQVLFHNNLPVPRKIQDTMIMSWMVDENTLHGLKFLARHVLNRQPKHWTEVNRQIDLFTTEEDIMLGLAEYCCNDVINTYDLYFHFLPLLKKEGLDIAYERVELKVLPVLCRMEMRGIKVDVNWLNERNKKADKELFELEKEINKKIKEKAPEGYPSINLRSPKQLQEILYNILNYKAPKETEKGTKSTDVESLQEIIRVNKLEEGDIVPMLMKFRDLDKVNSTYFAALSKQAGLTSIIHCNFKQHGTRTGRLSSSDPNMQNIPSRNDEWNVRQAFIPREGYKFLMADYSQLELRILAHFSLDENMVHTFKTGGDIHAETMKAINSNRHTAKTINFGLVYGMGPRSLAQDLHIKEEDAKRYINRFFDKYHQVKYFIDRTQVQTLHNGYVEMITGRRRHFTEIADRKWWNMIARQAVNTKIQGSAADLVKVAMIKLYPLLKKIDAHILVQIHDEVIVEVPIDKVEEAKEILRETMEHALEFEVPMVVNITEGERWVKE